MEPTAFFHQEVHLVPFTFFTFFYPGTHLIPFILKPTSFLSYWKSPRLCHLGSNLVLLMLELATSLSCWNMEPTHLVPFILESTMHHVFCFFSDQIIVFFNTYLSRCLFAGVDGRPVLDIMTTPQLISFSSDATRSTVAVEL